MHMTLSEIDMENISQPAARNLEEKIRSHTACVGIVGLGYVGLPLAVEFAKAGFDVTGIDANPEKVARVNSGDSYVADIPSSCWRRLSGLASCALPRILVLCATWTRSTSVCRRPCAKPRTLT